MELSFQHPRSGEWAHDCRDPLREARFTYIAPIMESWPLATANQVRMLEVGFGRGLNTAMASCMLTEAGFVGEVLAYGCEPNPQFVQPWPQLPAELEAYAPWWGYAIDDLPMTPETLATPVTRGLKNSQASLHLYPLSAAETFPLLDANSIDWIFLDLFSPAKHADDWQPELWPGLAKVAAPGAILTSYTCARRVRDGLEQSGWQCEVLRRPNYRDTLRARFLAADARKP